MGLEGSTIKWFSTIIRRENTLAVKLKRANTILPHERRSWDAFVTSE